MLPGSSTYPHARLKVLDEDKIDISLLYPTVGLSWESECEGPKLAAAYTRAYNDWTFDFCKPSAERLVPIAHVSLLSVEEGSHHACTNLAF
ncbi:MAG: hypothetical protein V3U79_06985 [Dehalococcoidia bacterium]